MVRAIAHFLLACAAIPVNHDHAYVETNLGKFNDSIAHADSNLTDGRSFAKV